VYLIVNLPVLYMDANASRADAPKIQHKYLCTLLIFRSDQIFFQSKSEVYAFSGFGKMLVLMSFSPGGRRGKLWFI
jgi:hypothetical protein